MKYLKLVFIAWCFLGYAQAQQVQILHYTETRGYDHNTRNQSLAMFQAIGAANGFTVTNDNDGSEFNSLANLQQYAVIIFANTSGNGLLSATQEANLQAYIAGGGSYIGIHAGSDTYRHSTANGGQTGRWDWYAENLSGCSVQNGPNHTSANHNNTMDHMVPGHPVLSGIPSPWNKTEEYYYWQNGYLNALWTELLRVRQTGGNSYDAPRMMAQCRDLPGGGRSFYTALGHASSNYTSDVNFRKLMENAVLWCMQGPAPFSLIWPEPESPKLPIQDGYFQLDAMPPVRRYRVYSITGQLMYEGELVNPGLMPIYPTRGAWVYMAWGVRIIHYTF